jgi:uncharacterized membrane protein (UPF0127 family)
MTMTRTALGPRSAANIVTAALLANLLVGFGLIMGNPAPANAAEMHPLEIVTKSGVQVFTVEEAKTEEERERGLMFRTALPEGQGMIFDFSPEQNVSMWMKNTLIPLDMIFIRADGRILRIAENTKIKSEDIIPSGGPVRAVVEVIAGTARKFGIAAGDKVSYASLFKR